IVKKIKRIVVRSSAGNYPVVCGVGAIAQLESEIARLGKFSSLQVVTSPKVWASLGRQVQRGLGGAKAARIHIFNDAETAKNLASVELIAQNLVKAGADRGCVVIAVGGGVVGDVAGLAAA